MRPPKQLRHEFVENIPQDLADGVIYISIAFATVTHKCSCGCGHEVVTPLSPTDWQLTFDGQTISLYPSIGNWSLHCKSHYWVKRNQVIWADEWTEEEIRATRALDRRRKAEYFGHPTAHADDRSLGDRPTKQLEPNLGFWRRLRRRFRPM